MTDTYIYDHVRTPRGKGRPDGSLHEVTPVWLASRPLVALRERNQLDTAWVEDVAMGCVGPVGEQGGNIARMAVLNADYDQSVPAIQIDRACGSGLEAVAFAAAKVMCGQADLAIGGGIEMMSRVPMGAAGGAWAQDPHGRQQDLLRDAGHLGRPARQPARLQPGRQRQLRRREPSPCRAGLGRRPLCAIGRASAGLHRPDPARARRDRAPGDLGRVARRVEACLRRDGAEVRLRHAWQCSATRSSSASRMCTTPATARASSTAPLRCWWATRRGQRLGLQAARAHPSFATIGSEPTLMLDGPAPRPGARSTAPA
jgi:hypothetical protein